MLHYILYSFEIYRWDLIISFVHLVTSSNNCKNNKSIIQNWMFCGRILQNLIEKKIMWYKKRSTSVSSTFPHTSFEQITISILLEKFEKLCTSRIIFFEMFCSKFLDRRLYSRWKNIFVLWCYKMIKPFSGWIRLNMFWCKTFRTDVLSRRSGYEPSLIALICFFTFF